MFIILTGDLHVYQPMPSCYSPKLMGDNVEPSLFLRPSEETSSNNERSTLANGTVHLHTVPLNLLTSPVSQVNPFPTPESSPEKYPTDLPSNFCKTEEFELLKFEEDPTSEDLIGDVYNDEMMGDNVEPSLFLTCTPSEETSSTNERSTLVNGTDHLHTVPLNLLSSPVSQVDPFPTPESSPEKYPTDLPSNFCRTEEFELLKFEEDPTSEDVIGDVQVYNDEMMLPCQ